MKHIYILPRGHGQYFRADMFFAWWFGLDQSKDFLFGVVYDEVEE